MSAGFNVYDHTPASITNNPYLGSSSRGDSSKAILFGFAAHLDHGRLHSTVTESLTRLQYAGFHFHTRKDGLMADC